jgi:hypothetical protein
MEDRDVAQLGTGLWNRMLIDATRSWKSSRRLNPLVGLDDCTQPQSKYWSARRDLAALWPEGPSTRACVLPGSLIAVNCKYQGPGSPISTF